MSDNSILPLVNDSAVIEEITLSVYQAILAIQQQQPELLQEKYRMLQWGNARYQSAFLSKLRAELAKLPNWDTRILQLRRFLQIFLLPSYFKTSGFRELTRKIRGAIPRLSPSELNGFDAGAETPQLSASLPPLTNPLPGIAILLLDAENLQLDLETEKFLAEICAYPIQIKVAFANWRSMGKQDTQFHSRGYELIHVPPGKDSADIKMATVGSSIFVHYPTAREVLVCSSDGVMTHLYTTLQTHGLTVYLVRKQGNSITVLNSKTNQTQTHSLLAPPIIPSREEFIAQLKDIIKAEQARTGNPWVKLSRLSNRFQTKYKIMISHVISIHFPGKKVKDMFLDYPADFVIHQLPDHCGVYVTLFDLNPPSTVLQTNTDTATNSSASQSSLIKLASKEELQQALARIVNALTINSQQNYVAIANVASEFQKQYTQSVTQMMRDLNLGTKFPVFLQSCSIFHVKKVGKAYQVAIREEG
ncbi:MAG TPA: NYN domain-containing protein [Cyanobacteria bacterium UBA8803]|nr:NYN domain-containing protein [Cyanobacteria bacterium UBA9273]HBL62899.1 NYN domain-containing protein [Cyanobacteria bacterium UBA8803]